MKKTKKLTLKAIAFLTALILIAATGCDMEGSSESGLPEEGGGVPQAVEDMLAEYKPEMEYEKSEAVEEFDFDYEIAESDFEAEWENETATKIVLETNEAKITGEGAAMEGEDIVIGSPGTYVLNGSYSQGGVIIDSTDSGAVKIVFDGVDICNPEGSALYVKNAEKVIVTLNGENKMTDAEIYEYGEDAPNAAVFSRDDLVFNGSGYLEVSASYNEGISCRDDLVFISGHITVTAPGNGIEGKDSLIICGGDFKVEAGNDAIRSNNDTDEGKGFVVVEKATLDLVAGGDGIHGENGVLIIDGDIEIISGGGCPESTNMQIADNMMPDMNPAGGKGFPGGTGYTDYEETDKTSTKGVKAGETLIVKGGNIELDCLDDGLHSNGSITITGGNINIKSGDDGIHADVSVEIMDGTITILECYEGVEGAQITIAGGNLEIMSYDDAVNISDGSPQEMFFQNPGYINDQADTGNILMIEGGQVWLNAYGDGIDVNGSAVMNGGVLVISGPVNEANGAIDYARSFTINGGLLAAAGSLGMLQAPDASSTQNSVVMGFDEFQEAGSAIRIENEEGKVILTLSPAKEYQAVVFSSPDLETGESYSIFTGGTVTGVDKNGIFAAADYEDGELYSDFKVEEITTYIGTAGSGQFGLPNGGFRPGGMQRPGGRP